MLTRYTPSMSKISTLGRVVLALSLIVHAAGQDVPFRITEFLAVNANGLQDVDDDYSDWIEIHNQSDELQNLAGWHLSDDPDNPTKWAVPSANVAPDGYSVIIASGKNSNSIFQLEINTNFTLSRPGGYLALADPEGNLVQELIYPDQQPDVSYGVDEDGQLAYYRPTPGGPNEVSFSGLVADTKFSVDRGFFTEGFLVHIRDHHRHRGRADSLYYRR